MKKLTIKNLTLTIILILLVTFNHAYSQRTTPMIWGINGHPFTQAAYWGDHFYTESDYIIGLKRQIDKVKELGMSYYRFDLIVEQDGNIRLPWSNQASYDGAKNGLIELYNYAISKNIKLLVVIGGLDCSSYNQTQEVLYNNAKSLSFNFATKYGQYFDYIELGNELDIQSMLDPKSFYNTLGTCIGDGYTINNYDRKKIQTISAYLKGLNDGLKSVKPNIKTIINAAGYLHFGFFNALMNEEIIIGNNLPSTYCKDFDIVGWHFYDNQGDINNVVKSDCRGKGTNSLSELKTRCPGKDIWITEINYLSTDNNLSTDNQSWIENNFKTLYNDNSVKAVFIYELFSQNYYKNIDGKVNNEGYFGLVNCADNQCVTASNKSSFDFYKLQVEKLNNGNIDLVQSWYLDMNCSWGDNNGKVYWANKLNSATSYNVVMEFLGEQGIVYLNNLFQNVLGRVADGTALTGYNNQFKSGDWEGIIADVTSSNEAWTRAQTIIAIGTPTERYVEFVFNKILGRISDVGGKTWWVGQLGSFPTQVSRKQFINTILKQDEYATNFVKAQFQILHQRNADQVGLSYWIGKIKDGTIRHKTLISSFLSSDEYLNKSINRGYKYNQTLVIPTTQKLADYVYIYNNYCSNIQNGVQFRIRNNEVDNSFINVVPNPFGNTFKINTNKYIGQKVLVTILEQSGKVIRNMVINLNNETFEIDLSENSSGMYILKINGESSSDIIKIIKE